MLQIHQIIDTDRARIDYGNIDELAASISQYGLLQPIRINREHKLLCGGRRLTAMRKLGWETLIEGKHYVVEEDCSEAVLREIELEENVRRLDMTWQERCRLIAKIHLARRVSAGRAGEQWLQSHTGQLLGVNQSTVSYALTLANKLDTDAELAQCSSARDAMALLVRRSEAAASQELAKRIATTTMSPMMPPTASTPHADSEGELGEVTAKRAEQLRVANVSESLGQRYVNMDCLEHMRSMAAESVPHIITDPPYGIDMEMLQQDGTGMNVESVVNTHDVKENETLFAKMLPEFYRVLKPTGFCVMFCDAMQWQRLYDLAVAAGFKVQRWPLVWLKTHACMNQMAGFNFTKNFELAMVCRKDQARLVTPQLTSIMPYSGLEGRDKFSHPFVKPAKLWQHILKACVPPSDWFYDPFMGEGSSVLAGLEIGVLSVGCELEAHHYNKALVHISNTLSNANKEQV